MNKNSFFKIGLIIIIMLGITSCSSDSDTNEPIIITVTTSDFTTSIDENPTNGQVIGTVTGTTNQGSVSFYITEQSPSGAFAIDSNTGELTVADEFFFDFEVNPTITGTVKVANGDVFENSIITIGVNDLNEENVFIGNVYLETQEEVEEFGANNYTEIMGLLKIGADNNSSLSIVNISSLASLIKIGESLSIHRTSLENLIGLENINSIGLALGISHNDLLTNIDAISNLTEIPNNLSIYNNPILESIEGLSNISTIGDMLFIASCDKIVNLDALNNLTNIGDGLMIQSNPELVHIDGLSNVLSFKYIDITTNVSLINLDGLNNNTNQSMQYVNIKGNTSLISISGLNNIESIDSNLSIANNTSLISLNGIENITNIEENLDIGGNKLITNINELINITSLNGTLSIRENQSLLNLNGLQNLSSNLYNLVISHNENLTNLNPLSNIASITEIRIDNNYNLIDFCGLNNIIINEEYEGLLIYQNEYNPTEQDFIDGNCSL